jgi:hypothetical protein
MDRTEFFRRQADRFSKLAGECTDPAIRSNLLEIAKEYREMLNGKASDDGPEEVGCTPDMGDRLD